MKYIPLQIIPESGKDKTSWINEETWKDEMKSENQQQASSESQQSL